MRATLFRKRVSKLPPTSRGMAPKSLGSPNPFPTLTVSLVTLQDKVHLRIYSSLRFLVICNIQVKKFIISFQVCSASANLLEKNTRVLLSTAIATASFLCLITVKVSKNTVMFSKRKAVAKCMVQSEIHYLCSQVTAQVPRFKESIYINSNSTVRIYVISYISVVKLLTLLIENFHSQHVSLIQ